MKNGDCRAGRNLACIVIRKSRSVMTDQAGNFTPLAVCLVIIMLLAALSVTKFMELWITATGVRDSFEEAIISVVTDNYNETYHCVREGYAGGYEPTGYGFYASVDQGDMSGRLAGLLGLTRQGDKLVKRNADGGADWQVSGISVTVQNTQIRNGTGVFSADGELLLEIPVRFEDRELFVIPVRLKVKARMREKF